MASPRSNYCTNACEWCHSKKLKCDKASSGVMCSQCKEKNLDCKTRTKKKPGPKPKNKNHDNGNVSPDNLDVRTSPDGSSDGDFINEEAHLNVSAPYSLSPISPNYSSSSVNFPTYSRNPNSEFPFHAMNVINNMSVHEVYTLEIEKIRDLFDERSSSTMSNNSPEDDNGSGLGIKLGNGQL